MIWSQMTIWETLLGALPFTEQNLHTFDLLPVGPLLPLRFLVK
jgi:hypothetical protein